VLLVDDGSTDDISSLEKFLKTPNVYLLRHEKNMGPGAARNTGIRWCKQKGIEIVLLMDSDCIAERSCLSIHLELHESYPDVAAIGGAIQGVGNGPWARLDALASWFTSLPGLPQRNVGGIFHIPTTNMSLKLSKIPLEEAYFNEHLRTGEDVEFVNRLRALGCRLIFHPAPLVRHMDRETLVGFLKHQFRWALHTYVMRFGSKGWSNAKRYMLALAFLLMLPAFAVFSSALNAYCLVKVRKRYALYYPPLLALYFIKGAGVFLGICKPGLALYDRSQKNT
jgi:glycosyltransferase involved in cell wall biosynthesis